MKKEKDNGMVDSIVTVSTIDNKSDVMRNDDYSLSIGFECSLLPRGFSFNFFFKKINSFVKNESGSTK